MRAKKANSNFLTTIVYIILLLGLIAGGFFVYRYMNTQPIIKKDAFFVQQGDKVIQKYDEVELTKGEKITFDVKYSNVEHKGYSLVVAPNITEETNFTFYINDYEYVFIGETNLINGFDIEYSEESFSITNNGLNIEGILSKVYPEQSINIPDVAIDSKAVIYFNLVIYSYDKSRSVVVGLRFANTIDSIALDKEEVIIYDDEIV